MTSSDKNSSIPELDEEDEIVKASKDFFRPNNPHRVMSILGTDEEWIIPLIIREAQRKREVYSSMPFHAERAKKEPPGHYWLSWSQSYGIGSLR
jgi:hypothetical protein